MNCGRIEQVAAKMAMAHILIDKRMTNHVHDVRRTLFDSIKSICEFCVRGKVGIH